jgi:hypothetical protein
LLNDNSAWVLLNTLASKNPFNGSGAVFEDTFRPILMVWPSLRTSRFSWNDSSSESGERVMLGLSCIVHGCGILLGYHHD